MGNSKSEREKFSFNFVESSLENFHLLSVKGKKWRLHSNTARTNLQVLEAIKDVTRIRLPGLKKDTTINLGRQLNNS